MKIVFKIKEMMRQSGVIATARATTQATRLARRRWIRKTYRCEGVP
jgi:hypothetical protein